MQGSRIATGDYARFLIHFQALRVARESKNPPSGRVVIAYCQLNSYPAEILTAQIIELTVNWVMRLSLVQPAMPGKPWPQCIVGTEELPAFSDN
jgi:hypothetical protein